MKPIQWQIAFVAVVAVAVVGYLLSASAQRAGAAGEVPGQGLLLKFNAPACIEQTADQLKANRQRAGWAAEVLRQQKAGSAGAWVVAGAGSPNVNGVYYRVGRDATADYYCNEAGMVLSRLPQSWAIMEPPPSGGVVYVGAADTALPGGKWAVGPVGSGDAPTVTKTK